MIRIRLPLITAAALAGACLSPAMAQVPDLLPYQGYIVDDAGAPATGEMTMTFRVYASGDSPAALWTEQWDVQVEDGVFYVYLGMFSPISQVIGTGEGRYLGVAIEGEGEAAPRQRIGSVPYAMMARDAETALTLGGYTADDFVSEADLSGYARWDALADRGYVTWVALGERGYATQEWVRQWVADQGYVTAEDIGGLENYATQDWVREWVAEQDFATEQWVRDQGYATEGYVQEYVSGRGYLGAGALDGYATEQWVRDQGYIGADGLADYATEQWVRDQGYIGADGLADYATEQWVRDQGYATEGYVQDYVAGRGYLGADALDGYATEQWVRDQGYLTGADLDGRGYATQQWVRDQGYLTDADLAGVQADISNLQAAAANYVTNDALAARGYITGADVDARGYVTADALDDRGYATTAYVDTLRADVSRTYVTINALDNRNYVTTAALDARNYVSAATLAAAVARIDALEVQLAAVVAAGQAYLLGRSNQASNGRFAFNGATGIKAANAMCRASFPNDPTAHFCSPDEVFRAVSSGGYAANTPASVNGVWTWAIAQTTRSSRGNNSLNANCQNLMYNSADASNGTRLRVSFGYTSVGNGGGLTGDVVQMQDEIACGGGNDMPVLCCR